jgi:hypothetical protein
MKFPARKNTGIKGEDRPVCQEAWDRIYITTLFSFEFAKISQSIDFATTLVNGETDKIFVGGIAASLMHDQFNKEPRWRGTRFIKGLLGGLVPQSRINIGRCCQVHLRNSSSFAAYKRSPAGRGPV